MRKLRTESTADAKYQSIRKTIIQINLEENPTEIFTNSHHSKNHPWTLQARISTSTALPQ
jgi:hypothetical protein